MEEQRGELPARLGGAGAHASLGEHAVAEIGIGGVFDLVDPAALAGKPVAIVATGGGPRHALVVEHAFPPRWRGRARLPR
jgi:hypothetical protein